MQHKEVHIMSGINGSYFNYSSSLFSSASSSSSSSSILGDYMSLKNGSYKKLLKAYYAKQNDDTAGSNKTSGKTNVSKAETAALDSIKTDSSSLKNAVDALTKKNSGLFEKVSKTVKDEQGNETTTKDYDWDKITTAVKAFADSYNKTLDSVSVQENDNVFILRKTAMMAKTTATNKNLLNRVGITVGADNKLTVDEDKLKSADVNDLKTLFGGYGSYASGIGQRASDITKVSEQLIKSANNANASTYTNSGNYSALSTGSLYDSLF